MLVSGSLSFHHLASISFSAHLNLLPPFAIASAILFGASIESMRQLQESAPEQEYRSHKTTLRGQRRR